MGVNNFSFCILLTRPQKHALSEFQLFTKLCTHKPYRLVICTHHLTLILTSDQRYPNSWRTRSLAKSRRAWM